MNRLLYSLYECAYLEIRSILHFILHPWLGRVAPQHSQKGICFSKFRSEWKARASISKKKTLSGLWYSSEHLVLENYVKTGASGFIEPDSTPVMRPWFIAGVVTPFQPSCPEGIRGVPVLFLPQKIVVTNSFPLSSL